MGLLFFVLFLFLKPTATGTGTATASTRTTTPLFFLLLLILTTTPSFGDIAIPSPSPPRPLQSRGEPLKSSSFRPSIAIIVAVLTTLFSIIFLVLLYVKHCKRDPLVSVGANSNSGIGQRKNSGIDRSVVESLPVFRFASLRGQKDGLECAVCLNRFESREVLRLLPKCKHAFHVECVDTWLDAHSTCPLCRYRVDPEDVLLIDDASKLLNPKNSDVVLEIENNPGTRRVSGRHSFAGEQRAGHQIQTWSIRKSFDSWNMSKKKSNSATVGCFDRPRKDGLLLGYDRTRLEHRIIVSPSPGSGSSPVGVHQRWSDVHRNRTRKEHRIIVSPSPGSGSSSGYGPGPGPGGVHQRWSDVQPSDLLYLRSEMIMSEGLLPRQQAEQQQNENNNVQQVPAGIDGNRRSWSCGGGSSVINSRSVSEITELSRFSNRARSNETLSHQQQQEQQRQLKLVARWLAWVSSLSRSAIRPERTTTSSSSPPPIC